MKETLLNKLEIRHLRVQTCMKIDSCVFKYLIFAFRLVNFEEDNEFEGMGGS